LIVAATLLVSCPAVPQTNPPEPSSFDAGIKQPAIVQVICRTHGGYSAGTAFRIGKGIMLSVKHVTNAGNCSIGGKPLKMLYTSPTLDFSMIAGGEGPFLKVDCGGFIRGRHYISYGYARGLPFLTSVELVATGHKAGQFSILEGVFTLIPGMSGGALVDKITGAVVGTNNVFIEPDGLSGSVALADTPICKGANVA
jgi:hypothetical protein